MDVKGIWGAVGLALAGFMFAAAVTHPNGVAALGGSLDTLRRTTASGMLGGSQTVQ